MKMTAHPLGWSAYDGLQSRDGRSCSQHEGLLTLAASAEGVDIRNSAQVSRVLNVS